MTDPCRSRLLSRIAAAGLGCLWAGAAGSESLVVGPRAEGMGGVGVAATDDGVAQYYNPAAFGFFGYPHGADEKVASDNNDLHRKRWGVEGDVTGGARQGGDFVQRLKDIADVNSNTLRTTTIVNAGQLVELSKLGNAVMHSDDPGNAVTLFGDGGGTVRVWRLGLGVRASGEAAAYVERIDLTRVGLPGAGPGVSFAQSINTTAAPSDGSIAVLDPALVLAFQTGTTTAPQALAAVQRLDFAARQAGVSAGDGAELSQLYVQMNSQFGNDTLKDNQTQVTLRGLGVTEIPLTYGHPINDHFSVGGSLKLMLGRVYGSRVTIFDGGAKDQLKHANDQYEQSVAFGVDAGVLFRIPFLQVGLTGRNLNNPKFDGFTAGVDTFPDVTVDRQATLGVALIPWSTFSVEVDADLLRTDTLTPGYHTQEVRAGLEWNPWHVLALRAGLSENIAESDVGPLVHGGIGLNLWAVRIDLAAAMALRKEAIGSTDAPREAHASVGLAVDF